MPVNYSLKEMFCESEAVVGDRVAAMVDWETAPRKFSVKECMGERGSVKPMHGGIVKGLKSCAPL